MSDYIGISVLLAVLGALVFTSHYMDKPTQCHTFQRTDTSHIRLNSCTGEAHIVVRGPNGFEWQAVR